MTLLSFTVPAHMSAVEYRDGVLTRVLEPGRYQRRWGTRRVLVEGNHIRDFERMLAETGAAATPGVDFDRERGGRFLRLSYCGPEADMAEAAERLRSWLVRR